ncbi:putative transposase [Neolewinella xylanilytica]|uniref:Putative transposase n=1 Tax=Neolewinella xylanilytica TaxID=1514080 RepID=A0A2S6I8W0_9BACT|nr:transposase [Neolewinella xylanilytica]PPK87937.1 putative transposase [Neolewinella xylanilytica]
MYYPNVIYHVYNQSINSEVVYRQEEFYHLFLRKLRKQILPVADIFCYCLMPTHFHLQLIPKQAGIEIQMAGLKPSKQQVIHATFRSLLSSYTRRVNPQYERRGSLFRKTQYEPAYKDFIPESWELVEERPFTQYVPYIRHCFDYIHYNPVKAGLVECAADWPYSSASDWAGLREGTLCNYALAEKLIGVRRR